MRVLARNPAPAQLRRVEVEKGDVEQALASGSIAPGGAGDATSEARSNPDGLSERIMGSGTSSESDLSTSKEDPPQPVGEARTGDGPSQTQMAEETRENQGVVQKQFGNAAQVFLPAVAVEAGNRASTLITGGVANSTAVRNQGPFIQRTVAIAGPILLGVLTFMVGAQWDNVYIKQSAVGMAIPAADAVLDPLLGPVESSLTGGGGNGNTGNGNGGNGQQGMGVGEHMFQNQGMGSLPAAESQDGMGIERSTDLTSEGPDDRFAQVAMNE